jgi:hypothetical protein
MNNLRQVGIGLTCYASDHDGRYVPTCYYVSRSVHGSGGAWVLNLLGNLSGDSPAGARFGNTAKAISDYAGIETWFCPSNDTNPIGNIVGWPDRRANFTHEYAGNWYGSTHYFLGWGIRAWNLDNGHGSQATLLAGRASDPPGAVVAGDVWGYNTMNVSAYIDSSRLVNHLGPGDSHPRYFAGGNFLFNGGYVRWFAPAASMPSKFNWASAVPGHIMFYPRSNTP